MLWWLVAVAVIGREQYMGYLYCNIKLLQYFSCLKKNIKNKKIIRLNNNKPLSVLCDYSSWLCNYE